MLSGSEKSSKHDVDAVRARSRSRPVAGGASTCSTLERLAARPGQHQPDELGLLEVVLDQQDAQGLASPAMPSTLGSGASRPAGAGQVLRQREVERRALPRLRDRPDSTAVPLDDALADREADPGAGVLARRCATAGTCRRCARGCSCGMPMPLSTTANIQRLGFSTAKIWTWGVAASELDGVADQVLEELDHLRRVGGQHREALATPPARRSRRSRPSGWRWPRRPPRCEVDRSERLRLGVDARVVEHVVDHRLHLVRALEQMGEVAAGVLVGRGRPVVGEEAPVAGDELQRLLEVVRDDVGELLELVVRTAPAPPPARRARAPPGGGPRCPARRPRSG